LTAYVHDATLAPPSLEIRSSSGSVQALAPRNWEIHLARHSDKYLSVMCRLEARNSTCNCNSELALINEQSLIVGCSGCTFSIRFFESRSRTFSPVFILWKSILCGILKYWETVYQNCDTFIQSFNENKIQLSSTNFQDRKY